MRFLGIDTSNYTTSAALLDDKTGTVTQKKMLLPVKPGEKGLRQSDAVFHHTVQLPQVLTELFSENPGAPDCVGVSIFPRREKGSYMPCFLVGKAAAEAPQRKPSAFLKISLYGPFLTKKDTLSPLYFLQNDWIC